MEVLDTPLFTQQFYATVNRYIFVFTGDNFLYLSISFESLFHLPFPLHFLYQCFYNFDCVFNVFIFIHFIIVTSVVKVAVFVANNIFLYLFICHPFHYLHKHLLGWLFLPIVQYDVILMQILTTQTDITCTMGSTNGGRPKNLHSPHIFPRK